MHGRDSGAGILACDQVAVQDHVQGVGLTGCRTSRERGLQAGSQARRTLRTGPLPSQGPPECQAACPVSAVAPGRRLPSPGSPLKLAPASFTKSSTTRGRRAKPGALTSSYTEGCWEGVPTPRSGHHSAHGCPPPAQARKCAERAASSGAPSRRRGGGEQGMEPREGCGEATAGPGLQGRTLRWCSCASAPPAPCTTCQAGLMQPQMVRLQSLHVRPPSGPPAGGLPLQLQALHPHFLAPKAILHTTGTKTTSAPSLAPQSCPVPR